MQLVGGTVGNIFSNTVVNLVNGTTTPYKAVDATQFWNYVTAVASFTPPTIQVQVSITPTSQAPTITNTPNGTPTKSPTPVQSSTSSGITATATDALFPIPFNDSGDTQGQWNPNPYITAGAATQLLNSGSCAGWANDQVQYHSPFLSYADSPHAGTNKTPVAYAANSKCYWQLHGQIDLTSNPSTPILRFWDTYLLSTNAHTDVCIDDHTVGTVTCVQVHTSGASQANYNWQYEEYDLTNFGGKNFNGKKIDIAFVMDNSAGTLTADGWYVDDIFVGSKTTNSISLPYQDTFNNLPDNAWLNSCHWGITTADLNGGNMPPFPDASYDPNHFASNPKGQYAPNDMCWLTLDGVVDLSTAPATGWSYPELSFWSWIAVDTGAKLSVQYSLDGSGWNLLTGGAGGWINLQPKGASNSYVWDGTSARQDSNWSQVKVDLSAAGSNSAAAGKKIHIRFLVNATGAAAPIFSPASWDVDSVKINNDQPKIVNLPFLEPFATSLTDWSANGWTATTATNLYRSGANDLTWDTNQSALTDSPTGVQANGQVSYAQYTPNIDMTSATDPVVTFWTQWDIDTAHTKISLDMSPDGGTTWKTVWERGISSDWPFTDATQRAWQRVAVDLGSTFAGKPAVQLRFQSNTLTATGTHSGWIIDDLSVVDKANPMDNTTVGNQMRTTQKVNGATKIIEPVDGLTSDPNYSGNLWYPGGNWQITTENPMQASGFVWSDSPNGNYLKPEQTVLQYSPTLDLTGSAQPTLYFWTRFDTSNALTDLMYVDVIRDTSALSGDMFAFNGTSSSAPTWTRVWSNNDGTNFAKYQEGTINLGWHMIAVDLTSYANQKLHVRFRLQANTGTFADDGWYVTNVGVMDRQSNVVTQSLPYVLNSTSSNVTNDYVVNSTGSPSNPDWIGEDAWGVNTNVNNFGAWKYLNTFSTPMNWIESQWSSDYWHVVHTNSGVWGATPGASTPIWPSTQAMPSGFNEFTSNLTMQWTPSSNKPFTNNQVVDGPSGTTWGVMGGGDAYNEYWITKITRTLNVQATGSYEAQLIYVGGAQLRIDGTVQTPFGGANNPSIFSSTSRTTIYNLSSLTVGQHTVTIYYYYTAASGDAQKLDFELATTSNLIYSQGTTVLNYAPASQTAFQTAKYFSIPANSSVNVSFYANWSLDAASHFYAETSTDGGFTWKTVIGDTQVTPKVQPNWTQFNFTIDNATSSAINQAMVKWVLDSRSDAPGISTSTGVWLDQINIGLSAGTNVPPYNVSASLITTVSQQVTAAPIYSPANDTITSLTINTNVQSNSGAVTVVGGNQFQYVPNAGFIGTDTFTFTLQTAYGSSSGIGTVEADPPVLGGALTVHAQDYDFVPIGSSPHIGSGFGYYIPGGGNQSGQTFRTGEAVDVTGACDPTWSSDPPYGAYKVGWTTPNEWLRFTINVTAPGQYQVTYRAANGSSTATTLMIGMWNNGTVSPFTASSVTIPGDGTGNYCNWATNTTSSGTFPLSYGKQTIALLWKGGSADVSYFSLQLVTGSSIQTQTPTFTPTQPTFNGIRQQIFQNISTSSGVGGLTNDARFNYNPNAALLQAGDTDTTITTFDYNNQSNPGPVGVYIVGYLKVTTSRNYYFWLASDDPGELWLDQIAGDTNFNNATRIAYVTNWTSPYYWAMSGETHQASGAINLSAGTYLLYGVECNCGGGGALLQVAVKSTSGTPSNGSATNILGGAATTTLGLSIAPY
jgi:hypothetical protein